MDCGNVNWFYSFTLFSYSTFHARHITCMRASSAETARCLLLGWSTSGHGHTNWQAQGGAHLLCLTTGIELSSCGACCNDHSLQAAGRRPSGCIFCSILNKKPHCSHSGGQRQLPPECRRGWLCPHLCLTMKAMRVFIWLPQAWFISKRHCSWDGSGFVRQENLTTNYNTKVWSSLLSEETRRDCWSWKVGFLLWSCR